MASPASGYLAREWIPATSARAFREQIERLGSIPYAIKFVFFCFSKSGFIKETMNKPKFGTHVPHLGAGEYLNFLILERLLRKLDASCTLVKLCWSLLRSAEAFSPGDRRGLLIYDAQASHGLARIGIPSAWMNPRDKRTSFSRADWKAGFDSLRY